GYASLLKSRRQALHRTIAQLLTERFPDTAEAQPEVLAHHYTEAGQSEGAVAAWRRAGEQAVARAAIAEAAGHYGRAVEVLDGLPDTPARAQEELALQAALGHVLVATKGYSSPEVAEAFARARALAEQLGDTEQLLFVLVGLWASYWDRGEVHTAQALADEILRLAERDGVPAAFAWAP